jgi:hypothetical protein
MGLPTLYLGESLHVVSAAHDDDNLYLMYRFSDERLARSVFTRGVLLWFNGDGKTKNKEEVFGIRYAGSEEIRQHFDAVSTRRHEMPDH